MCFLRRGSEVEISGATREPIAMMVCFTLRPSYVPVLVGVAGQWQRHLFIRSIIH